MVKSQPELLLFPKFLPAIPLGLAKYQSLLVQLRHMKSTDKLILSGFAIIIAIGLVGAVLAPQKATKTKAAEVSVAAEKPVSAQRTKPVGISEIASSAYTRDQYPTTFAKFGSAVRDINADRLKAAKIAALHSDCDYVENAQITTRSLTKNRRYWVECSNLTRLFFDEESLARGEPVEVQTKTIWMRDGLKDW